MPGDDFVSDLGTAAEIVNPEGASPYVLICDHASNFLPAALGSLGLSQDDLQRHIAWDPGAQPVSRYLSEALDAVLVESRVSRLAIDCNRPLDAPDLIAEVSETTVIPGNAGLSLAQRDERIAMSWTPFHDAVDRVVGKRLDQGRETMLVSIHSFNPVYRGVDRPWHIGIIHDSDIRLAGPMIDHLKTLPGIVVGVNEPYSPADRVYFTLEKHGRSRGLACAMIEIRNDEIRCEEAQRGWAQKLAAILSGEKLVGKRALEDMGGAVR
ncbi:N-formylglutamate amidohydrolase [Oryzicola mucosus]|uniref:N-formylglutamate amidohydrolase n=1 Tax=Oryzicola mucosus TaxID=2767425 RepID=A0A8J6U777_9HYPH|nr:N-formylglutamate amidohydrolase [Oryzicola mucosus]MBD0414387.1 N-formylglutamate amidohydrolase [Oryzicola mucosus]